MNNSSKQIEHVVKLLQKHMPKGFRCSVVEQITTQKICEYPGCVKKALWKTDCGLFCSMHMKEITKEELRQNRLIN